MLSRRKVSVRSRASLQVLRSGTNVRMNHALPLRKENGFSMAGSPKTASPNSRFTNSVLFRGARKLACRGGLKLAAFFAILALLFPVGCGGKRPTQPGAGTGAGPGAGAGAGAGPVTSTPLLLGVFPDPLLVSVGDVVKIIGINFQNDLSKNTVSFISGSQRIPGIPIRVDFPSDGNPSNGLESELQVVVPGGISTGNVEVRVSGVDAGSRGFDARPQIMACTLGRNETQTYLLYVNLLGFSPQASFVKLFGLNFNEIDEVQLEDGQGGSARISPNAIERNPAPPAGTPSNTEATGYSVIGFNLKDTRNDVRLNFVAGRRENMKIRIKSAAGLSNTVEVPVHSEQAVDRLGAIINGVKVPTGVRTGQVRVHYTMYDHVGGTGIGVDINYRMEVLWKLAGEDATFFRVAKPAVDDPEQSGINNLGTTGILPGAIGLGSPHRLFPGDGALRTFTWDAPNDPALKLFMSTRVDGQYRDRFLPIQFLLRPTVEANNVAPRNKLNPNHDVITPTVLYYYIEDRTGDVVSAERVGKFAENFNTDVTEDTKLSTANLGPPNNPGALVGKVTGGAPVTYGTGTAQVHLLNAAPEDLLPDATKQYYLIDTDDLSIVYRQISNDGGTPCNLDDDELAGGGTGQREEVFENPGSSAKEFHLATLELGPNVQVFVRGLRPLVVRLKGTLDLPDEEVFVAGAGSKLDLNGCPGEDGPRLGPTVDVPGNGGKAGAGGGDGGIGASITDTPLGAAIASAERGARDGGEGGETTLAVDVSVLGTKASTVPGGPGGGGGNRTPGQPGDSGLPTPQRFAPPRAGKGGLFRGESHLLQLSPGSGGGGGGLTLGVAINGNFAYDAGAGGGGGGGALRLVANGQVVLDSTALVEANGGKGGNAVVPKITPPVDGSASPAPGGGGSGGCIQVQARGSVDLACESLRVLGGTGGTSTVKQNQAAGAGNGGEGWIRVESAEGGVPTCSAFVAETSLTLAAKNTDISMTVTATDSFPSSGTVQIFDATTGALLEELSYLSTTPITFDGLIRGAGKVALPLGAKVVLKGSIAPLSPPVLSEGGVIKSPDSVEVGRGRDGELHFRFEASLDTVTGKPVLDPVTGEALSIWRMNTDTGVVSRPSGDLLLEVAASDTNPGRLECTRLVIDARTTLRVEGSRPLQIFVTGQADIGGTIDVSGLAGGVLRFSSDHRNDPDAGLGGASGPGGGGGGEGGITEFVDGNIANKAPENTLPLHAGAGLAPAQTPEGWDKTSVLDGNEDLDDQLTPPGSFLRAKGGLTLRGQKCGGAGQGICVQSPGGGGGGGNIAKGSDGNAFPEPGDLFGEGGSVFGLPGFRFDGDYLLLGGTGGGGGGGNPHISGIYKQGYPGAFRFKSDADHAPGTGGGGGGGVLRLSVENLNIRPTGRILARGGDAYQSIDLGGNGGAGAGGSILIQVKNALTIAPGALLDVSGGTANVTVPILPGQSSIEYPGNFHLAGGKLVASGGEGGNGAPGRIRIEADASSLAALSGVNANYSSGPFLPDSVFSIGVSKAIRLGVGPGLVAGTHQIELSDTIVRFYEFGQPNGTDSAITWQGARESLDVHGGVTAFSTLSGSAGLLGTGSPGSLADQEFVRFVVPLLSNGSTRETQAIREIQLPYSLPVPTSP